jgi:hypothetical protein
MHEIGFGQDSEARKLRNGFKMLAEQLQERGEERNRKRKELHDISMELAVSLFEVFEALKKISSGPSEVRTPEIYYVELIAKLKYMVNMTTKNVGEMIALIFVNRKAFHIFGYTQTEVKRGLNVIEMFIPEDRERVLQ